MQPLPTVQQASKYSRDRLLELQGEISERRIEALRLYHPSPKQDDFHASTVSERLVIGGNRSGKTFSSAMEIARAATGQDPYKKYAERDGVIACVGRNWSHIWMVMVPYLLRAGAYKIIRDEQSGEWRAFDPVRDVNRKAQTKPAPPLLPPRMIKSTSWMLKSAGYCNNIELHNGWRIFFFSAEGEAPQGFQADLVWCDEDLLNDSFLPELQARLADRKGRLVFSAMPHSKSDSLLGLSERADRAAESGVENPTIKKWVFRFLDNEYIDGEEKSKMIERWAAQGEEVLRMRAEGEFTTDSNLDYPTFHSSVHGYDREDLPNKVSIPEDWTHYASIDPGHTVAAAVFAAVPPDNSMILIYDELYLRQANARTFGEEFAKKVGSQPFNAFIIDMHGGRITDIGSGKQVVLQYVEQLRDRGIRSATTGSGFIAGCDDIAARTSAVRTAMHIRPSGTPKLRVLRGTCPNLIREINRYRKKTATVNGMVVVTDTPNTRGEVHAVQTMEYLVAYEPKFVFRKPDLNETDPLPPWFNAYMARKSQREKGSAVVYFGPESDRTNDMEANLGIAEWV
jgi:hypothetical protein